MPSCETVPGVRQSIFSNMEFGIANLLAYIFLFNNKALFAVALYQISGLLRLDFIAWTLLLVQL